MKRRKHRLFIDVTFSHALTKRDAAKGMRLVFDERLDNDAAPVWLSLPSVYLDKIQVKEFTP